MSIDLEDYRPRFTELGSDVVEVVEAMFRDAARQMTPNGLAAYLAGALALSNLGRRRDLVIAFLHEMPHVAKECGDDVIEDCVQAAMKLSSMTSGEVITLLIQSLPTAARRLGDPELLRGYLALIHQISAKAPRGLRPMLNHIDELLSKLTLSGLRRWATFGAEAHRTNYVTLVGYFSLETQDSQAMLRKERRGTLFINTQRKLNFYLRALWGRDFFLRPAAAETAQFRPHIEHHTLYLPDAVDPIGEIAGPELFRAMAAHLAAHVAYTRSRISAEQLTPAQMFFIGLVEDARVEYVAMEAFPGLRPLWRSLLAIEKPAQVEHPALVTLEAAALMLLDPAARTGDRDIDAIIDRFHAGIADNRENNNFSWHVGLELFNVLAARRDVPSLRILEQIRIPYRDDNRFIWEFEEFDFGQGVDYIPASQRQVRRTVNVMEMVNEVDCELAGEDAQEVWRLETPFWLDQEACTINELEGKEPVSDPFYYQEWDYQVQLYRPDWATVYERRQPKGDPADIDRILDEYRPVTFRIRQIIDMLQPEGVQRVRNMEDGDEIDINAAVDAMIAIRMGQQPDTRITMRNVVKNRDLAVLILLDLSESTNETVGEGGEKTVLQLTREASALVATAISGIGDPFAIHGFASDSRHDVQYFRFKDFNAHFDDQAKSRLAGMRGGLSTRMGAAMRHAAHHLLGRPERHKLILLVTDGEPADIDERDPQHLRHDTRKAVEELYTRGILTYCLTLDPNADDYVKRIFGQNNYTIVDHVRRLPETLPVLFASLTR
ncbi:MAG: VWA domain-containing protein, partial [Hyphomicrobiales bacterium]